MKVTAESGLEFDYTGADAGTGDVVIRMARIPGLVSGIRLYAVDIDSYGRVTGGSTTPPTGGCGSDIGMDPVFDSVTATDANFDTLQVEHAQFLFPLPASSGGTGVGKVPSRYFFAGAPALGADEVPLWRPLTDDDLPEHISFLRLHGKPSTISGYGITDAYTKAQVDAIIASVVHDNNLPSGGDASQVLMGDRNWHTPNTDMVAETTTHLYFTASRARAALSSASTNVSYDAVTGEIGLVPVPEVEQIHVKQSPTQPDHAVSLSFLQGQYDATGTKRQEFISVTSALAGAGSTIPLQWTPKSSQHIRVLWNGLDCAGFFQFDSGTGVVLNSSITLTVGDSVVVDYHS